MAMSKGKSVCALCLAEGDLRKSHIVPKFVYRYLLETQPGKLRQGESPNKRLQDGPTMRLLCQSCESRLSGWEREFANRVFFPLRRAPPGSRKTVEYGPWAALFAASVTWRVLQYQQYHRSEELEVAEPRSARLAKAAETWRRFVLGQVKSPGPFELHVYIAGAIKSVSGQPSWLSDRINFYLLRSVDMDFIQNDGSLILVYAKLPGMFILGFASKAANHALWKGGKLNLAGGALPGRKVSWPVNFFEYINSRATRVLKLMDGISDRQREKIRQSIDGHGAAIEDTETFQALLADAELAGRQRRRPGSVDGTGDQ